MLTKRFIQHNKHHYPDVGAIVGVNLPHKPDHEHRYRRFIVTSFPGIEVGNPFNPRNLTHLVNLKALDNGETCQIAHQWLEILE
jgi:hypothetical protein